MKELKDIITNSDFITSIQECEKQVTPILQKYLTNFPDYTDHSIVHSKTVLNYALLCIGDSIKHLTEDEKYILVMAAYLHDIGMCPSENDKKEILKKFNINDDEYVNLIRNNHHELSFKFVEENWEKLKIPNKKYANAIGLVAMGHRKVNLFDFDVYELEYIVKGGTEFVCLPYLAGMLRLADELDITNDRTPDLLFNKYYPDNKISREEWGKHRANYFVNFKSERIIITAECSDLNIYYGLVEQKNKIELVLKECHRLIRLLPADRVDLKINYHQIEHKLEAIGFIPKQIGFSFDFQNTFDAFIGRNLYDSDFVAIREVIQNSIDTCLYKKSFNKSFKPKIEITLINNELIIEDNGLGMDYFIIENYFAKLNSSYYQQTKISKNYDSISQFGVGVFSYFLLCDYFDVETKSNSNQAIKFRVTKISDNSFYFFDDASKVAEGTKITLYLNNKLDFNDIVKQVEFYFTFLDIPISLSDNEGNHYHIQKKQFKIDKSRLIIENVNLLSKDRIPDLDVLESKLVNDNFEGLVNMFVVKKSKQIKPESLYKVIDKYHHTNYNIYQKGIFVSYFSSVFLNYTIGNINLKSKHSLNISRNQFKDNSALVDVIIAFEKDIIRQVFESWTKDSIVERHLLTTDFVNEYINIRHFDEEFFEILKSNWILKIYEDNSTKYISLGELFALDSFVLLNSFSAINSYRKNENNEEQIEKLYNSVKKPILIIFNEYITKKIIKLAQLSELKSQLIATSENHFFVVNTKEKANPTMRFNRLEHIQFLNDNSIIAYPNIGVERYLNSNHPIIIYLLNNETTINKNSAQKKLFEELLELLRDFIFNYHLHQFLYSLSETIKKSNEILKHINSFTNQKFRIKKSDFPNWVLNLEKKKLEADKKRKLTRNIRKPGDMGKL